MFCTRAKRDDVIGVNDIEASAPHQIRDPTTGVSAKVERWTMTRPRSRWKSRRRWCVSIIRNSLLPARDRHRVSSFLWSTIHHLTHINNIVSSAKSSFFLFVSFKGVEKSHVLRRNTFFNSSCRYLALLIRFLATVFSIMDVLFKKRTKILKLVKTEGKQVRCWN